MNQNIKKLKSIKNKGSNSKLRKKRRELSSSINRTINKINSEIVLDFD